MAGFFALLYGTFMLGASTINKAKKDSERASSKKKAIEDNSLTYIVGGQDYFTENDLPCMYTHDLKTHHRVIVCTKGINEGKILYDFDALKLSDEAAKLNKAIEEAKHNNKQFLYYSFPVDVIYDNSYTGIEIETGRKYLVYELSRCYLQYLEDKPTTIFRNNRYVSVYKLKGECIKITKEEYMERIR